MVCSHGRGREGWGWRRDGGRPDGPWPCLAGHQLPGALVSGRRARAGLGPRHGVRRPTLRTEPPREGPFRQASHTQLFTWELAAQQCGWHSADPALMRALSPGPESASGPQLPPGQLISPPCPCPDGPWTKNLLKGQDASSNSCSSSGLFFFFFLILFIHLSALSLHCCMDFPLVAVSGSTL